MRIGIVNDLFMAVHVLSALVERQTSHQIAWVAYDGAQAVEKCREDRPDIILMDLIMPVMDGVEATRQIMNVSPCAILIVTSDVSANLDKVYDAMGVGALDVVMTPSLDMNHPYATTVELIGKIEMIEDLLGLRRKRLHAHKFEFIEPVALQTNTNAVPLLVIGASTGGPKAILHILSQLPPKAPFATVVIQHLNEEFVPGLISWLNGQVPLDIKPAIDGQPLLPGNVYLPVNGMDLTISNDGTFSYLENNESTAFKPSIDIFFASVAKYWSNKFVGVLLTGMGEDGARGLKKLKEAGWYTIAQNKETSIVYGMPRAALEQGAVTEMLPLEAIPTKILELLGSKCTKTN
jgi:two-component system response regulator WspF